MEKEMAISGLWMRQGFLKWLFLLWCCLFNSSFQSVYKGSIVQNDECWKHIFKGKLSVVHFREDSNCSQAHCIFI